MSQQPRPATADIFRVDRYVDNAGRMLEVHTKHDPTMLVGHETRYLGFGQIRMNVSTPMGTQQHLEPITFPITATTIEEAFAGFDEAFQLGAKQFEARMKAGQIAHNTKLAGNLRL